MNRKSLYIVLGGVLGASLLVGTPACTDDHYDIVPAQESAANTIWENIQATAELDSLAMILERTRVYRSETDNQTEKQYYSELLDGSQTFTLWAPINGTYDAKSVLDQLDEVDALRTAGSTDEANTLEYAIASQFVQNHLARFNYESSKDEQEVRMMNSKICYYNAGEGEFNGVALSDTYTSIPSSNGNIHGLEGQSPFAYNIFDYIKAYSDIFSQVYATLSDSTVDKTEFDADQSIEGAMNENGEMVYVDSVYTNTNTLLTASNASIKDEDSLYVAFIPSDLGWDDAIEKIGELYTYGTSYQTDYSSSNANIFTSTTTLDADSLQDYNTKQALISSMFFSPGYFDEEVSRSDSAAIIDYVLNADSLIATNGKIMFNPTPGYENPMLTGMEPIKASNGYIFAMDEYTIDPTYFYQEDIEVDLTYSGNIVYTTALMVSGGTECTLVSGSNWDETIYGEVEDDTYRFFQANGAARICIALRNVLSGTYKISMQVLPNRINTAYKLFDDDGEELIDYENNQFRASVHSDTYSTYVDGGTNATFTVNQDSIQTITLFDAVTFDKCYADLPSDMESFPVLVLEITRQMQNHMEYDDMVSGISAKKVILEPVHE